MRGVLLTDLNDEQCEKVVGGAGRGATGGSSAGANAWGAGTDFNPSGNSNAGLFKNFTPGSNEQSAVSVIIPVPR